MVSKFAVTIWVVCIMIFTCFAEQTIVFSKKGDGIYLFDFPSGKTRAVYAYPNDSILADLQTLRSNNKSRLIVILSNPAKLVQYLYGESDALSQTVLAINVDNGSAVEIGTIRYEGNIRSSERRIVDTTKLYVRDDLESRLSKKQDDPYNSMSQMANGSFALTENGSFFIKDSTGRTTIALHAARNFSQKKGSGGYASPEVSPDKQKVCYIFYPKLFAWGSPPRLEEFNLNTKTSRLIAKGDLGRPKYSSNGNCLLVEEVKYPKVKYWVIDLQTLKKFAVCADCHSAAWVDRLQIAGDNK